MSEYIKREAALRIVKNYGKSAIESGRKTLDPVDDIISLATGVDLIPTEDVVEVVRCEECKYKEDCARQMVHTTRDYVLEQNISSYNKVDFCSYGEKRSEGK